MRRSGTTFHRIAAPVAALAVSVPGAAPAAAQHPSADSVVTACIVADTATRWKEVSAAWSTDSGAHWANDGLRRRLLELARADQASRLGTGLADSMRDSSFVRRMLAGDSARAVQLRAILDRYGWPGRSLVGAAGSSAAFLIAQHNAALQHDALRLMRALPPGEVSPSDQAMLEDRVLVSDGKPQRYGTQLDGMFGDTMWFNPIADLPHLEARRTEAGLPPLSVYMCMMRGLYGRPVRGPEGVP